MRTVVVGLLFATVALAGCSAPPAVRSVEPTDAWIPTDVQCRDAADIRARASAAREQIPTLTSDQARLDAGNRANVLVSLEVIANLRCRAEAADDVDGLIVELLDAARLADGLASAYQRAQAMAEVNLQAQDVVLKLVALVPGGTSSFTR